VSCETSLGEEFPGSEPSKLDEEEDDRPLLGEGVKEGILLLGKPPLAVLEGRGE